MQIWTTCVPVVRIEGIALREIEQRAVHFLGIPGIPDLDRMGHHLRVARHRADIGSDFVGETMNRMG